MASAWRLRLEGNGAHVAAIVKVAPSSAPRARSTEHEMHVNVGVSRSVYELDSVVRSCCTNHSWNQPAVDELLAD